MAFTVKIKIHRRYFNDLFFIDRNIIRDAIQHYQPPLVELLRGLTPIVFGLCGHLQVITT
jgi:hypothetical protein